MQHIFATGALREHATATLLLLQFPQASPVDLVLHRLQAKAKEVVQINVLLELVGSRGRPAHGLIPGSKGVPTVAIPITNGHRGGQTKRDAHRARLG